MSIYAPIVLITLPPHSWELEGSRPWARLLEMQAIHGRRFAKGVELREVRFALLEFARKVSLAVESISAAEQRWNVPHDMLPGWYEALVRLADARGREARRSTERFSSPRFLPCLFAPARESTADPDGTGLSTVTRHLQELSKIIASTPEVTQALIARRARFEHAATVGGGLVEWMAPEL